MARRCLQRRRTPAYDQVVLKCTQQAGGVTSLAFSRLRRPGTRGQLAWLTGYRAGFYGAPYVRPLGALDPQKWALGFLEGRGHRGRM
jgi:hypothetical protein